MTAPVRELLIDAILAATAGRYGLEVPEDERDLPLTLVSDEQDDATASYDHTNLVMPVNVGRVEIAISPDRNVMRQQAHAALAQIITQMHADETFGGLAQGVDYQGGGIFAETGKLVFATALFQVRYRHLRGQPHAID